MFLKVGGAIRDRQNVKHEEKRHRVLLAHHYANVARKHQKKILEKLRVDFLDLGKGFAHKTLDELHETELTNLKAAHSEQFVIERADYGAGYNLANIRGWYNSTVYNETILILNRTFANNHMMVNKERTRRDIPPLRRERRLDELAREHAKQMANKQRLFHHTYVQ